VITLANLRGVKESGRIFAIPTYVYITVLSLLVGWGLFQVFFGDIAEVEFKPEEFEGALEAGGSLSLFLVLKGFSSGAVALTGVEAISNGVPAFKRPESKNAAATMVWMGVILGTLFFGVSVLASHLKPYPSHDETVFSQLGQAVFGGGPLYVILQFATAAILTLAANTAYADFPRLSSIIARDGYLPRQLSNRGDRLVFSNGIIFLAIAAGGLLVAFKGLTNALIPLYAVGVFTSFTLSQWGMVRHHRTLREKAWRSGVVINATGAIASAVVLLIVAGTKFTSGAWVPLVVVPFIIGLFVAIKTHYRRLEDSLRIEPADVHPEHENHTVVVLVGRIHRGVVKALHYARSLRPNHITALYISVDADDEAHIQDEWNRFKFEIPLEIVNSPYRDLTAAVEKYLEELDARWDDDTITVVIPEFVAGRLLSPTQLLHNQSAGALKLALLYRRNTVVISVPYHVDHRKPEG